jgi:hypothetical protein
MGLFDMPDVSGGGGWGGLLTSVVGAASQVYQGQIAKQQAKRAAKLTAPPPFDPYYGYTPTFPPGMNAGLRLQGAPVPYGGSSMPVPSGVREVFDPYGSMMSEIGGFTGWVLDQFGKPVQSYDPTPGPWAANDPRSQDAVTGRGHYDKCGRWVPYRPPTHPSKLDIVGSDGKTYTYVARGNPVLFRADISGVKRVQRVAALCASALGGRPTRKRSAKRRGRKRRKVSCRTLSPKQLAAGFGGKQYR